MTGSPIFSVHFAWLFLNRHMIVWFSWIISICEIYGEYRTAGHLVFWKPWPAVELKNFQVSNDGFVFWAQREPNAILEIYKAFQDCLSFLNRYMHLFDLWNLMKRQECRSFSILKTLTGYRPYSHSEIFRVHYNKLLLLSPCSFP